MLIKSNLTGGRGISLIVQLSWINIYAKEHPSLEYRNRGSHRNTGFDLRNWRHVCIPSVSWPLTPFSRLVISLDIFFYQMIYITSHVASLFILAFARFLHARQMNNNNRDRRQRSWGLKAFRMLYISLYICRPCVCVCVCMCVCVHTFIIIVVSLSQRDCRDVCNKVCDINL